MQFDNHVPWGHKRPRSRFSQWCEWHGIDWHEIKGLLIAIAICLALAGAQGSLFLR